jgi:hypothetical protein
VVKEMEELMEITIPENCNPFTKEKFEAIESYDRYEDAITNLNRAFHESYNNLIHSKFESLGKETTPVIIMIHEDVILFHNDKEEKINVIPKLYHQIKGIGHVSFGVYVTLMNNGYGTLRPDFRETLTHQKELIEIGLKYLEFDPLPMKYVKSQRLILESARDMISWVLAADGVEEERVKEFCDLSAPLYLEGAALGAELEIDTLHETVMNWHDRVGEEIWENLHVVVCAAHQGRYRETTLQYFQRLLYEEEGQAAENEDRVIYAEHIDDPKAAMELLARHMVDQRASIDLFGSSTRLQQDLMADGAAAHLEELLPD